MSAAEASAPHPNYRATHPHPYDPSNHARPKSILKNASQRHISPELRRHTPPFLVPSFPIDPPSTTRPVINGDLYSKEVLHCNTSANAALGSHHDQKPAHLPPHAPSTVSSTSPRLKWDEENLYLTEQQ